MISGAAARFVGFPCARAAVYPVMADLMGAPAFTAQAGHDVRRVGWPGAGFEHLVAATALEDDLAVLEVFHDFSPGVMISTSDRAPTRSVRRAPRSRPYRLAIEPSVMRTSVPR
jgi:hypothetical protein